MPMPLIYQHLKQQTNIYETAIKTPYYTLKATILLVLCNSEQMQQ